VKTNYPGFIAPALATSMTKAPSGDRWIHEIKSDSYRVQVFAEIECRAKSAEGSYVIRSSRASGGPMRQFVRDAEIVSIKYAAT
jgi:ATP-dependent DNA ligase